MPSHYLLRSGPLLFALAVILLGLEHVMTGNFPVGLLPVPASVPARSGLAYLTGAALLTVGVGIVLRKRQAAMGAGLVFALFGLLLHAPRWVANPTDGRVWTALFELVALTGGAFILGSLDKERSLDTDRHPFAHRLATYGQALFAVSLLVFGGLHFVYGPFIATLIPAWIPGHLFWAYFVGVAFTATGISILLVRQLVLSTSLLGLMFLLWVLLLHAPRVWANPQLEPEWTSLLVALGMSGISFTLAGLAGSRRHRVQLID